MVAVFFVLANITRIWNPVKVQPGRAQPKPANQFRLRPALAGSASIIFNTAFRESQRHRVYSLRTPNLRYSVFIHTISSSTAPMLGFRPVMTALKR